MPEKNDKNSKKFEKDANVLQMGEGARWGARGATARWGQKLCVGVNNGGFVNL